MASAFKQPPRGLRDRQKIERERRIVRAAAALFSRRGYDATAMEHVAVRARLAVGTIYNYFPSKPDLLLAIVGRETDRLVERALAVAAEHPVAPLDAIVAIADILFDGFITDGRIFWRELMAAAMAEPARIGRRLFDLDIRLVAVIAELLESFTERGVAVNGLDAMRAAGVIYAVALTWINAWMMTGELPAATAREEIRRGIEIACRGILATAAPRDLAPRKEDES